MNDEPENNEPQPQTEILPTHRRGGWPKGKQRKFKPRASQPKPEKESEFAGMSSGEGWNSRCAALCNPKQGCVITRGEGSGNCGHPEKGGLQAADLLKPKVVERYNAARKYLAHLKVDKR
jgi:hypothetical protein